MFDAAAKLAPSAGAHAAAEAIPRDYNFAADIIERNLKAGRADKAAFIDPRGSWSYGQLSERVDRFGHVLRSLGIRREERILLVADAELDLRTDNAGYDYLMIAALLDRAFDLTDRSEALRWFGLAEGMIARESAGI